MKMTNNLCTWRRWGVGWKVAGVREWNGNTSAATWQEEKRAGDWKGGCLREGGISTWVQNGGHKPPSSSSQRQGDTGATVPIEVFVSRALSCFSSANRGYNEGGVLPSPRAKGLSTPDLSDPEWPNQPSHENRVNDLLPLALLLVKWVTAITSVSKTEGGGGSFLTCCWGDFASDSASSYKMH